ncbi:related to Putative 26S proteasome complex subunit sem-1 [Cephalotrichum gorgonifer]|uniref:26S proteasome complex subunit SEM1 n=1 Tax=Cephalotrichum gorgonifer TaxID=2041049 RepID=A0AAE8N0G5_9PEZI|nr:related to Putative 26S proteasome complex subunit sem-1 [Cephalotrichum gorgonifer]
MASSDPKPATTTQKQAEEPKPEEMKPAAIGEDDEFEDFPVEDWPQEETEAAGGANTKHLWEESWDDDDTTDDFSTQLREELKKVESAKKR